MIVEIHFIDYTTEETQLKWEFFEIEDLKKIQRIQNRQLGNMKETLRDVEDKKRTNWTARQREERKQG